MQNSKLVKQILSLFLAAGFASSCGPKNRPVGAQINTDENVKPLQYEAPLAPTTQTPTDPQLKDQYQTGPQSMTTESGHKIYFDRLKVQASGRYNSTDKRLQIEGTVELTNEQGNEVLKKDFNLIGLQKQNMKQFELYDENDTVIRDAIVRASAKCIGIDRRGQIDCSHILIDLLVKHHDKIYAEQFEIYPAQTETRTPPVTPEQTDEPTPDQTPVAEPDAEDRQDQTDLQSEDGDQSLNGRYQGTLEQIDINQLFGPNPNRSPEPTPTPVEEPTEPPQAADEPQTPPPSTQESGDSTTAEPVPTPAPTPVQPAPRPAPTPTPAQPAPRPTPAPTPTPAQPAPRPTPTPTPAQPAPRPAPTPTPAQPAPRPAPVQPAPRPTPLRDVVLDADRVQTADGIIRPINQAIGFPDQGRLRNATSVLSTQQTLGRNAFFEVVAPGRKKHFATFEMAELLTRIGSFMNETYTKKLYVANISLINGGPVSPHASHQMGVDVDLAYPSMLSGVKFPLVVKMQPRKYYPSNYSVEKTYNLFKFMFKQDDIGIDRVFVDQSIIKSLCDHAKSKGETSGEDKQLVEKMFSNLQHIKGHGDHFHVRIKCSKRDPGCRSRIYRKMPACR